MKEQNELMNVYLDKLFKKHDISPDKIDLTPEQKEKVRGIVENIQSDVEKFLENTEKAVTEHDMSNNQNNNPSEVNEQTDDFVEGHPEPPTTKPKVYVQRKLNRRKK